MEKSTVIPPSLMVLFSLERTPCMSRVLQINNIISPSATQRGDNRAFQPFQRCRRLVTETLGGIIVRRPVGTISIFCQEFLIKRVSLLNIDAAPSPTFKNFDIGTKFPLESGLQERKNFRKINFNFNFKLKHCQRHYGPRRRLL